MKLFSRIGLAGLILLSIFALGHAEVVDNTDPGFSTVESWPETTYDNGYYGPNYCYAYQGDGAYQAIWSFNVTAGQYELSAWWPSDSQLAPDATYKVLNNGVQVGTQVLDQTINGSRFNSFDQPYTLDTGTLEVVLDDNAGGFIVADAVQAELIIPPTETECSDGVDNDLDGDTDCDDLDCGCTPSTETDCRDGVDNDDDGLFDCEDTEDCGTNPFCLPPTASLTADPTTIEEELSTTLSWTTSGADIITIDPEVGPVNAVGTRLVSPDVTTIYTITAWRSGAVTATDSVTITVTPKPTEPVVVDNSDPEFSFDGDWPQTTYDTGYYGPNYSYNLHDIGEDTATWSFNVTAGRYEISAYWPSDGALASNATCKVMNNGGEIGTQILNQQINGSQFNPFDTTYAVEDGTLNVTINDNADGYIIADAVQILYLGPTTETSCIDGVDNNDNGLTDCEDEQDCATATICQPLTATLTASPDTIAPEEESTLTWSTTGAYSVTIDPDIGPVNANGTQPVTPDATTIYTITASRSGLTVTDTATVTVSAIGKPVITGGTVSSGTITPGQTNTSDQFIVDLTGTRDPGTAVWIDGVEMVPTGDTAWSVQMHLEPGTNNIDVWLRDPAGITGPSESVGIELVTGSRVEFHYDDAGRVRRIDQQ